MSNYRNLSWFDGCFCTFVGVTSDFSLQWRKLRHQFGSLQSSATPVFTSGDKVPLSRALISKKRSIDVRPDGKEKGWTFFEIHMDQEVRLRLYEVIG